MSCGITTWIINEGTSPTILERVLGHDGAGITADGTNSIAYAVYDIEDSDTAIISGTIDKSTAISDTYQTDARWTVDSTGYNFEWAAPATIAPDGGKTYQVQLTFTPSSGGVIKDAVRLQTRELFGE